MARSVHGYCHALADNGQHGRTAHISEQEPTRHTACHFDRPTDQLSPHTHHTAHAMAASSSSKQQQAMEQQPQQPPAPLQQQPDVVSAYVGMQEGVRGMLCADARGLCVQGRFEWWLVV